MSKREFAGSRRAVARLPRSFMALSAVAALLSAGRHAVADPVPVPGCQGARAELCRALASECRMFPAQCRPAGASSVSSTAAAGRAAAVSDPLPAARLEDLDAKTVAMLKEFSSYSGTYSRGYATRKGARVAPGLAEFSLALTGAAALEGSEVTYRIYRTEAEAMLFVDHAGQGRNPAERPAGSGPYTTWQLKQTQMPEPTRCIDQPASPGQEWIRCFARIGSMVSITTLVTRPETQGPSQSAIRDAASVGAETVFTMAGFTAARR